MNSIRAILIDRKGFRKMVWVKSPPPYYLEVADALPDSSFVARKIPETLPEIKTFTFCLDEEPNCEDTWGNPYVIYQQMKQ